MGNEILIPPAKGFNPFVDLTKYNFGAFSGNRLVPQMSEQAAAQAEQMGSAAATAIAAGQQAAEDIAKKQEQEKQAEQEARKRNRFSMLVDYFRPKSAEERMVEADARNRAQDEREQQKMAMDREFIAQGAAMDFQNKLASYREPSLPPLVELGKDYFGRSIMTNRPASTVQEQAKRVEKFNLAPGSLTQFAMGGLPAGATPEAIASGKEAVTTLNVGKMMQESLQRGQQIAKASENGWIYDRALGRYVKSKSMPAVRTPLPGTTIPTSTGIKMKI